jgi:cystathionine gamma-synthase
MSSIYSVHQYLLSVYNAKSVLFGYAFHSTPYVLDGFGPDLKFLGIGSPEELIELETCLKEEAKGDSKSKLSTPNSHRTLTSQHPTLLNFAN